MIGLGRFLVENIGAVASDLPCLKRGGQRSTVHKFAPGAIEKHGVLFEKLEPVGIDEVARLRREVHVQRNNVRTPKEIVHIGDAFDAVLLCEFFVPINIVTQHVHTERTGAGGDFLADAAEAGDADRLTHQFVTGESFPFALVNGVVLFDYLAIDRKQQPEGVLSDRGVVHARAESNGQLELRGCGNIHLVEADAVFGDDFEARERLLEHGAGDSVIAAEEGVKITSELEHARLGKRAAFTDNLVTFRCQHLMVRPGGVLK